MPRKKAEEGQEESPMEERAPRRPMSEEHKAALAAGREEGRIVRRYLEALESYRPRRGRKRTAESMRRRLEQIDVELPEADPLSRLALTQERMDLEAELAGLDGDGADLATLEKEFIRVAASYSRRKGITYAAWREIGVVPSVLKAAGIGRES